MNSLFKWLLKDKGVYILKYSYEWKSNDSLTLPREKPKSVTRGRPAYRGEGSNPGGLEILKGHLSLRWIPSFSPWWPFCFLSLKHF